MSARICSSFNTGRELTIPMRGNELTGLGEGLSFNNAYNPHDG